MIRFSSTLLLILAFLIAACGDDDDGLTDSGPPTDGATPIRDGEMPTEDAQTGEDSGPNEDAGPSDAGTDAGDDASVEMGPLASFITSGELEVGAPVSFDGSGSSGDALRYVWRFPSGEASGEQTTRVFAEAGSVEVSLTVVDSEGRSDTATETISIAAGPAATGSADLTIRVVDSGSNPVADAVITLESVMMGTTDASGVLSIDGVDAGIPVVITIEASGFAKQVFRSIFPADWSGAIPVAIRLLERADAIRVEQIEDGATVDGILGARLTIAPGAIVDDEGNPISGAVDIYLTAVDVSDDLLRETFPGAFEGVGPTTEGIRPLASLGTVELLIVPAVGGNARIRPGAEVELDIPISADALTPTDAIELADMQPSWSLDERTGLWVREGQGEVVASPISPSGMALRVRATTSSWFNADVFFPRRWTPRVRCRVEGTDTACTATGSTPTTTTISAQQRALSAFRTWRALGVSGQPIMFPEGRDLRFEATSADGLFGGSLLASGDEDAGPNELVIDLEPLDPGGMGTTLVPPVVHMDSLAMDEADRFVFSAGPDEVVLLQVSRESGSLSADISLYVEGGPLVQSTTFGGTPGTLCLHAEQASNFAIVVQATSGSGDYTLRVANGPTVPMDTELNAQALSTANPEQLYGFEASADDQLNFAWEDEDFVDTSSSRVTIYDVASCMEIGSANTSAVYGETQLLLAPSSGYYISKLELLSGNGGQVTVGISDVDPPQDLVPADPFSELSGEITVLGKRVTYRVPAAEGDDITYAINNRIDEVPMGETGLAAYARLYEPSPNPRYPSRTRRGNYSVYGSPGESIRRPQDRSNHVVTVAGDYILLVVPTRLTQRGTHRGIYSVATAKPELEALSFGVALNGTMTNYVEWRRFSFTEASDADALLFRTTRDNEEYVYECLYDDMNTLLDGPRSQGPTTPSVEIARSDLTGSAETFEIRIEPTSGCTDGGRVFWTDPINYNQVVIGLDAPTTVTASMAGTDYMGSIDTPGERHYYRVNIPAGMTLEARVPATSGLLGRLYVYEEPAQFTDRPAASGSGIVTFQAAQRTFNAVDATTVLVEVDGGDEPGGTGAYTLRLTLM